MTVNVCEFPLAPILEVGAAPRATRFFSALNVVTQDGLELFGSQSIYTEPELLSEAPNVPNSQRSTGDEKTAVYALQSSYTPFGLFYALNADVTIEGAAMALGAFKRGEPTTVEKTLLDILSTTAASTVDPAFDLLQQASLDAELRGEGSFIVASDIHVAEWLKSKRVQRSGEDYFTLTGIPVIPSLFAGDDLFVFSQTALRRSEYRQYETFGGINHNGTTGVMTARNGQYHLVEVVYAPHYSVPPSRYEIV